ncbi:MAG: peptide deformylase, partial [Bdellovibrionales bacterium]|nr:peptide deformylase [Oligoflexia bacterium]
MAIRKVARMGHPVLREKAREYTRDEILSPATKAFVLDLIETMEEYGGIGIAAPQVHESRSIALIDYQDDSEEADDGTEGVEKEAVPLTVVINPKITVLDETKQGYWEGCLSVPEIRGLVYRPRKVQIDFLDLNAEPQTIIAEGFLATVFQHELDH